MRPRPIPLAAFAAALVALCLGPPGARAQDARTQDAPERFVSGGDTTLVAPLGQSLRDVVPCAKTVTFPDKPAGRYTAVLTARADTAFQANLTQAADHPGGDLAVCVPAYGEPTRYARGRADLVDPPGPSGRTWHHARLAPGDYTVWLTAALGAGGLGQVFSASFVVGPQRGDRGLPGDYIGEHGRPSVAAVIPDGVKGPAGAPGRARFQRGALLVLGSNGAEVGQTTVFYRADSAVSVLRSKFRDHVVSVAVDRGPNPNATAAAYWVTSDRNRECSAVRAERLRLATILHRSASFDNNFAYVGATEESRCAARVAFDGPGGRSAVAASAAWDGHVLVAVNHRDNAFLSVTKMGLVRQRDARPNAYLGKIARRFNGIDFFDAGGRARLIASKPDGTVWSYAWAPGDPLALADSVLLASGLDGPYGIRAHPAGYAGRKNAFLTVTLWGASNTVRLYNLNAAGTVATFQKAFGRAGPVQFGPYDERGMQRPRDVAVLPAPVTSMGRTVDGRPDPLAGRTVMIVQEAWETPRRYSVWDLDASGEAAFVEAWYGPSPYTQPGAFRHDTDDDGYSAAADSVFYTVSGSGLIEWGVTWGYGPDGRLGGSDDAPGGRAVPRRIVHSEVAEFRARTGYDAVGRAPLHSFVYKAPDGQSRRYFTDGARASQRKIAVIHQEQPDAGGIAKPVASLTVGSSSECVTARRSGFQTGTFKNGTFTFHFNKAFRLWNDDNEDGQRSCDEIDLYPMQVAGGRRTAENFNVVSADALLGLWDANGRVLYPTSFSPSGRPIYAFPEGRTASNARTNWPRLPGTPEAPKMPGPQSPHSIRDPQDPPGVVRVIRPGQTLMAFVMPHGTLGPASARLVGRTEHVFPAYSGAIRAPDRRVNIPSTASLPAAPCRGTTSGPVLSVGGGYGDAWLVSARTGDLIDKTASDQREYGYWHMVRTLPAGPARGTDVSGYAMAGENYGGDRAYVLDRQGRCRLVALDGFTPTVFETREGRTARIRGDRADVTLAASDLAGSPARVVVRNAAGAEAGRYVAAAAPVTADGALAEWSGAELRKIPGENIRVGVRAAPSGLAFAWATPGGFPLGGTGCEPSVTATCGNVLDVFVSASRNTNKGTYWLESSNPAFRGARGQAGPRYARERGVAAGDARIVVTLEAGTLRARLWSEKGLPGTSVAGDGCVVSSPLRLEDRGRGVAFELCGEDVTARVALGRTAEGVELVVPFSLLGRTLAAGDSVLFDAGVVVGNASADGASTNARRRGYLYTKSAVMTEDAGIEHELYPAYWGTLVIGGAAPGGSAPGESAPTQPGGARTGAGAGAAAPPPRDPPGAGYDER